MSKATDSIENRLRKADPAAKHASLVEEFKTDPVEVGINRANSGRGHLRDWFINRTANFKRAVIGGGFATATAAVAVALIINTTAHAPLISLGAGNPEGSMQDNKVAGDSIAGGDAMVYPFMQVEYETGPNITDQTSNGHVYQLVLNGSMQSRLTQLAEAFGLKGKIMPMPKNYGQDDSFIYADPSQGTAEQIVSTAGTDYIQISWSGGGYWSYYPNSAATMNSNCVEWSDDSKSADSCIATKPGPGISKSDAVAQALKIFRASGLELNASDIDFYKDDYYSTATTSLKVDGQDTAISFSASWDTNGNFTGAMGQSVKAVDRGEFATISAKDAIKNRLQDYRWNSQLPQSVWNTVNPGISTMSLSLEGDMVSPEATSETSDSGNASDEPMPVDGVPLTTKSVAQKITINSAEAMLLTIYDAEGNAWLVPGYLLKGTDNWVAGVVSIVDGVIELPKAEEVQPMVDGLKK
jgi:hypothetical protein